MWYLTSNFLAKIASISMQSCFRLRLNLRRDRDKPDTIACANYGSLSRRDLSILNPAPTSSDIPHLLAGWHTPSLKIISRSRLPDVTFTYVFSHTPLNPSLGLNLLCPGGYLDDPTPPIYVIANQHSHCHCDSRNS